MKLTSRPPSRRRLFQGAIAVAGASALFATPLKGLAETVIRMGLPTPATTPDATECVRYTKIVEQKSNGQLRFENYFNGTLAKQADVINGMQTGVVDVSMMNSTWLASQVPRIQALDLPFLFPSRPVMWKVLDGPIGRDLNAEVAEHGVQVLAWGAYSPIEFEMRDKSVKTPDDLKGMRVRIISSAISASMTRALGAIPVTIDVSEAYLALQQKGLDGLCVSLPTVIANKMYDVVKNVALTDHNLASAPLMMSKKRYDGLAVNLQKVLNDSAREFVPGWRKNIDLASAQAITDFQSHGGTVDQIDKPAFRKAMIPVYEEYRTKLGVEFVDRLAKQASG